MVPSRMAVENERMMIETVRLVMTATGKRKGATQVTPEGVNTVGRQFACPFHKSNARKYWPNLDTGTKYRSCQGPGVSSISKMK